MIAETIAVAAALMAIALILIYTLRTGAPPTPTSPRVKAAMLALVPGDLTGTIYELGSGWGTLALALARRYPGCRVVAYELSPLPWLVSRLRATAAGLANLTLRRADFHGASLADAGLVVCYLHPAAMERLRPKLEGELGPGAWVLSNTFAVRGWRPEAERTAGDLYNSTVYLYRVPARGDGT